jgi:hypothetical protein
MCTHLVPSASVENTTGIQSALYAPEPGPAK